METALDWEKAALKEKFVKIEVMKSRKKDRTDGDYGGNVWKIWGIPLFGGGMEEVLKIVGGWIRDEKKKQWIATVNPEFVMAAKRDKGFEGILKKTSLNVVDGVGLIWAKHVLCPNFQFSIFNFQLKKIIRIWLGIKTGTEILAGRHREGLVPGVELMEKLIKSQKSKGLKVFFLGGWNNRAEKTAKYIAGKYSGVEVAWCQGEPAESNSVVIEKINNFKPDLLFVAYGMKKQEEWIERNLNNLEVGVVMGVGRSFDYLSGELKRAPRWVRKMGMEWLYSLIIEPKRWRRQVELVKFVRKVLS